MEKKSQFLPQNSKIDQTKSSSENLHWATLLNSQIPISLDKFGPGQTPPLTLYQHFLKAVQKAPKSPSLAIKRNGNWCKWTYQDYFNECLQFSSALISLNLPERSVINIIGFNSPEWFISFYGSIFANCVPVGIYTTNGPQSCYYIANHSNCRLLVVQNQQQLQKYTQNWHRLPQLRAIIIYNPSRPINSDTLFSWSQFLQMGHNSALVEQRTSSLRPSQVASIIYTSGTTGPPKGVLLTHDNYTWTSNAIINQIGVDWTNTEIVSYLPLSHIAGQIVDIIGSVAIQACVYFAEQTALQGSLGATLQEVKPTFFMSVPRVFEKVEQKIKSIAAKNTGLKKKIGNWAKSQGSKNALQSFSHKSTSLRFKIARQLIFNKIKTALGLDRCKLMISGSAPLQKATIDYFLSLNMPILNVYGMSECTGVATLNSTQQFCIYSGGRRLLGTELVVADQQGYQRDQGCQGQICFRGRNRFMGYFKDSENTSQTIDKAGFLHSGDMGMVDEQGYLYITGRLKELIVTSGGQNIPPLLIEQQVRNACPLISNAFLVGDQKPFLGMLLTLKQELVQGTPNGRVSQDLKIDLQALGIHTIFINELVSHSKVKNYIQTCIDSVNDVATSNAQKIRKWALLNRDFSESGGELTPTMKVKRRVVCEKYAREIESFYIQPKL